MADLFGQAKDLSSQYSMGYRAMNPKEEQVPQANIPKFAMKRTQDFMQNLPNIQIQAPSTSALDRRYNALRNTATNRVNANEGTAANAIQRKFASQGASGSGAEISAMMQNQQAFGQQKEDSLNNIGAEQVNTEYQGETQKGLAQADLDFKNRVFNFDSASKMHELDMAERKQQQDAAIEEFNGQVAAMNAKPQKKGFVSNLLGGLF